MTSSTSDDHVEYDTGHTIERLMRFLQISEVERTTYEAIYHEFGEASSERLLLSIESYWSQENRGQDVDNSIESFSE